MLFKKVKYGWWSENLLIIMPEDALRVFSVNLMIVVHASQLVNVSK